MSRSASGSAAKSAGVRRWGGSLTALLAACAGLGCSSTAEAPAGARVSPHAGIGEGIAFRGVAVQMQSGFGPRELYLPKIREVAALGANTVLLTTAGYMEHAQAQVIFIDARKSPSPEEFKELIREAKKLGLRVIVMPIVLLSRPRGSEWRGVIEPPDWDDWWSQYRDFAVHFADIARDGGADGLIVGSELVSTEKYTSQWVKVIEKVREHYPRGMLGYSANWDHYKPVQFWDKLDFVGMTSYYTLADKDNPSVEEIAARWRPIYDEIVAWQRQVGRPIILTEVGWCSQEGAAKNPWNYYANMKGTPAGHEEQRRLYEAFIQVWGQSPALSGVIWWEWTGGEGGPADYSYTPKGKPAEEVLRRWFSETRKAEEARPAGDAPAADGERVPPPG